MTGEIIVSNYENMSGRGVLAVLVQGWLELIHRGYCDDIVLLAADDAVVAASIGDATVGAISYKHVACLRSLHINLGYVLPQHRRNGVYTAMWGKLAEVGRELGCRSIVGNTHTTNRAMHDTADALGRTPTSTIYTFTL